MMFDVKALAHTFLSRAEFGVAPKPWKHFTNSQPQQGRLKNE